MSTRSRIEILQNMPVFGGIREDILEWILDHSHIIKKHKGVFYFREGDTADCLYVLEEGEAIVIREHNNQEYFLKELDTGDCFGEMALVDFFPRSASVMAKTACVAIKLTVTTIRGIYQKDLEQYTLIQMNMGREISRRLRETDLLLFENLLEKNRVSRIFSLE